MGTTVVFKQELGENPWTYTC